VAAVVARAGRDRPGDRLWRALAALMALVGVAVLHATLHSTVRATLGWAGLLPAAPAAAGVAAHLAGLLVDGAALATLLAWSSRAAPPLRGDAAARVLLAAAPASLLLALALWQVRWLPAACAALAALLVTVTALRIPGAGAAWRSSRAAGAAFLLLALVPFPAATALFPWRLGYPATDQAPQVVARDLAHRLRAGAGDRPLVVAAPPLTTTWLIWFGGFQGLGTLYWENARGLQAMAALLSAPDEDSARQALHRHRVTHLLVPSWEPFVVARPTPSAAMAGERGPVPGVRAAGFLADALASGSAPEWLVPFPYEVPASPALGTLAIRLFEVRYAPR
jgi:hypothetical protein